LRNLGITPTETQSSRALKNPPPSHKTFGIGQTCAGRFVRTENAMPLRRFEEL
jgi:hypothetical protein